MNTPDLDPAVNSALEAVPTSTQQSLAWTVFFFFMVGLTVSLVVGWIIFPQVLYSKKFQPVDFNHSLHLDQVSDGCNSCHYFRKDGSFAGLPDLNTCADCHQGVLGSDPEEEKFVSQYVEFDKEVPWLSYFRQPDCVFFSHAAHALAAKMTCESCHGDIGHSGHSKVYEQNQISGYSRDIWGYSISRFVKPAANEGMTMKMNDCANCHLKETGYKGACFQVSV